MTQFVVFSPPSLIAAAPLWLPGGHLQTIWPALCARRDAGQEQTGDGGLLYRRERWPTPDGDFIDVDRRDVAGANTLLVLFHGLEGSSSSHYALAFAHYAQQRGFDFAVPHFRGCSGQINDAPRAYHSGDFEEVEWVLQQLRQQHRGRLLAVGVSLGGNALLRWAEEAGQQAARVVSALAAISAPVDLAASGEAMGRGFNRLVYTRRFLASMKPKALKKLAQFPGLFDVDALHKANTLRDFDNVFTAPLHGFRDTDDYWRRASAKPRLADIAVPTLVVNARNDPFVPAASLPDSSATGACVTVWQPRDGGHVGFVQGAPPGHLRLLPQAVGTWFDGAGGEHG